VVIDDLNVKRVAPVPAKANSPSVVYANAVLPRATALQGFESVAGRSPEIVEPPRLVQVQKLPPGNALDRPKLPNRDIVEQRFRVPAPEGTDHFE